MRDTAGGRRQRSDQVARIGLEHVLLFYDYLDLGDLDSCMSLLDTGASFHLPLGRTARGKAESGALARTHLSGRGMHRIRRRRTDGETVVVEGDFTDLGTLTTVGFTDLFGFSEHALISSWHRVHDSSRTPRA
ncbi:nuclear transport factor 2 family protein [Nocardiopsis ganjiahuensis]|uniref:nuclear transport factor 2 family protein n=1 Tax=Nocardiopsis ganjiahuensis TaxID=239984 RepID=UPI00034A5E81|nr:nuclear transport factor 2 family protein [Nocardiopsis ganjiahuensis]